MTYRTKAVSALAGAFVLTLAGCGGGDSSPPPDTTTPAITGDVKITTLSNRADMISDGDVYTEIVLPTGATVSDLKVDLNGTDVTSTFAQRPNGRVLGVVTGLKTGDNKLTATLTSVKKGASLAITNTDKGGPIFSGPQLQPWICATESGSPTTVVVPGTGLSATVTTLVSGLDADPTDSKCNAPTKFTYYYQPVAKVGTGCTLTTTGANPCFVAYDPAARPADAQIADFTNNRGDKVKSMIRLELGTIDRTEYQVLTYFDPAQTWTPWAPQKGWNGKLHVKFGGGASGNRFQSHPNVGTNVFDVNALAAGFMVANAQITTHSQSNNELLTAEMLMMLKEHIIDTYGEIRYTLSDGGSGGSMMQTVISSVMPGLLNGLQTGRSYPDAISTWMETRECGMLGQYYLTAAGSALAAAQRDAIEGKPNAYCNTWIASFITPQVPTLPTNCGTNFPLALTYDPTLRPTGVRCSIHDMLVNILGTIIDTDRNVKPKLPYDNVGVQYGLLALKSGALTPEQFVQLNETIGAYDADMKWTAGNPAAPVIPAPRFRALPDTFPQVYKSGLHDNAKNLANVSIVDLREDLGPNIHQPWRSLEKRARLDAGNGNHDNHVIRATTTAEGAAITAQAFNMSDRWWAAIEADKSNIPLAQKIIKNKPADVHDGCYANSGATAADLANELTLSNPACPVATTLLQKSPRQVAGGPLAEDIYKCQLKALDPASSDYGGVVFTAPQVTRLQAVFTDGVCDWTKPGVGQTAQWVPLNFKDGPAGTPIPAAPTSVAF